jgi:hypothetical protein
LRLRRLSEEAALVRCSWFARREARKCLQ